MVPHRARRRWALLAGQFEPMLNDYITYDGIPYLSDLCHRGLRVHHDQDQVYFKLTRFPYIIDSSLMTRPALSLFIFAIYPISPEATVMVAA